MWPNNTTSAYSYCQMPKKPNRVEMRDDWNCVGQSLLSQKKIDEK